MQKRHVKEFFPVELEAIPAEFGKEQAGEEGGQEDMLSDAFGIIDAAHEKAGEGRHKRRGQGAACHQRKKNVGEAERDIERVDGRVRAKGMRDEDLPDEAHDVAQDKRRHDRARRARDLSLGRIHPGIIPCRGEGECRQPARARGKAPGHPLNQGRDPMAGRAVFSRGSML